MLAAGGALPFGPWCDSMRAIVQNRYGSADVLELHEIPSRGGRRRAAGPRPRVVDPRRRLARDAGSALRPAVHGRRRARPKDLVPGTDLAGVVESVGANVTRFRPGDEVFGQSLVANLWRHGGAFAEYAAVPEARFESKPAGLTFEQAAAVPTSGSLAVQVVRDEGRIRAGQNVLINGAGGAVGTFAVQLAKAYGAHVTGVDAADKLDMIRSIGADRVLDYAKEDFTRSGERSDVDPRHRRGPSVAGRRARAHPRGTYVLVGHDQYGAIGHRWFGSLGRFAKLMVISPFVRQLHPFRGAKEPGDRLVVMKELIEAGKVRPVIDQTFALPRSPTRCATWSRDGPRARSSSPSDRDPAIVSRRDYRGFGRSR